VALLLFEGAPLDPTLADEKRSKLGIFAADGKFHIGFSDFNLGGFYEFDLVLRHVGTITQVLHDTS
jgi:hypothetical protein